MSEAGGLDDGVGRAALAASMDGMALLDADGRYTYVNDAHAALYGYDDPAAQVGESWEALYDDSERERFREEVFPTVRREGEWRGEAVGRRRDGSTFEQELSLSRTAEGELICVARDVTDRKRRARQLKALHEASRELIRAHDAEAVAAATVDIADRVLDHPVTALWSYDETGDGLVPLAAAAGARAVATPAASSSAGTAVRDGDRGTGAGGDGGSDADPDGETDADPDGETDADPDGETDADPDPDPDAGDVLPVLGTDTVEMRVFRGGETVVVDDYGALDPAERGSDAPLGTVLLVPLGEHGLLHVGTTEVRTVSASDRRLVETLARHAETALDRARHEATLRERETALGRQNDRLAAFASAVSHDLRNPLGVAIGRVELARDRGDLSHLGPAVEALSRMEALVDGVLRLARAGETVGDAEPVPLAAVVSAASESVPEPDVVVADELVVRADPERLRTVVENLLRNTVEHASTDDRSRTDAAADAGTDGAAGGSDVAVRVDAVHADGPDAAVPSPVGFAVVDDGAGFDTDDLDGVFDRGFTTSAGGTGYGLAIVRDVAEAHGWAVTADTAPGGGARVTFTGVDCWLDDD